MTMLEKTARALHAYDKAHDDWPQEWDDVNQAYYMAFARAALLAIREHGPTVHNVSATVDGCFADIVAIRNDGWQDLIDAILNEKPE